jgi:hypothetical protein
MYVCTCVYMCVCMHVCICMRVCLVHVCVCMLVCTCECVCTCVCTCIYVCTWVWLCVCVWFVCVCVICVCVCVCRQELFFKSHLTLFFESGSFSGLELAQWARVSGQRTPEITSLCFPGAGITSACYYSCLLKNMCSVGQTWVLSLALQALPAPKARVSSPTQDYVNHLHLGNNVSV